MDIILQVLCNSALIGAVIAWFVAQAIKTFLYCIRHKSWSLRRMHGAGGMPSSHTAMVISAAILIARVDGFSSTTFAFAALLAMIVIYDATGVRRAAGDQAKILNRLARYFSETEKEELEASLDDESEPTSAFGRRMSRIWYGKPEEEKMLEELLGHTLPEVLAGSVVGLVVGVLLPV